MSARRDVLSGAPGKGAVAEQSAGCGWAAVGAVSLGIFCLEQPALPKVVTISSVCVNEKSNDALPTRNRRGAARWAGP